MTRNKNTHRRLAWWVATVASIGTALALVLTPRAKIEPVPAWQSCFDNPGEAEAAGTEPRTALTNVLATAAQETRLAERHNEALSNISRDRRWKQQDQITWMTQAAKATRQTVAEHQIAADEAMATAACLENEQ